MKITSLVALASLVLATGCLPMESPRADRPAERSDKREDMRVMSFNVRYGSANDRENSWPYRKEQVLEAIAAYDPDLLGLQEALSFQSSLVGGALSGHTFYGPSRLGPDTDGEACSVYWRAERFELIERGTFWLSPTPEEVASQGWDAALPRICTWVQLLDLNTDQIFVFANTHFDHMGEEARAQSAKLLTKYFGDQRMILTGDFNAEEPSAPMQVLREAGLEDTFRVVHPDAVEPGTFTGFQDAPTRGKIDYVYFRGDAAVLEAEIDNRRRAGRWPSDHFPVTGTLRWK